MQIRIALFVLLGFFFAAAPLSAQQRFGAGIVAGINASQIQGDDSAGYNRLGVRAGLRGIAKLTDRADFGLDLLYSQRGSTSVSPGFFTRSVIHLDYIEVPVWFSYKDWLSPGGYYRLQALAGLSYGRLFNSRVIDTTFPQDQQGNFSKNDLSISLGASFYVSKKFSLGINWTRSILPLYNHRKHLNSAGLPHYRISMWGFFLSFQGVYEF